MWGPRGCGNLQPFQCMGSPLVPRFSQRQRGAEAGLGRERRQGRVGQGRGRQGWGGRRQGRERRQARAKQGRATQQSTGIEVDPVPDTLPLPAAPRVQGVQGSLWGLRHLSAQKGPADPGAPALRPLPVGTRWAVRTPSCFPRLEGSGGSERPRPQILTEGPGCPMGPCGPVGPGGPCGDRQTRLPPESQLRPRERGRQSRWGRPGHQLRPRPWGFGTGPRVALTCSPLSPLLPFCPGSPISPCGKKGRSSAPKPLDPPCCPCGVYLGVWE